jgi:hypothetical protein
MPDWSAGTKELYFASIAAVGVISEPGFHSDVPRGAFRRQRPRASRSEIQVAEFVGSKVFHVEHLQSHDRAPRNIGLGVYSLADQQPPIIG